MNAESHDDPFPEIISHGGFTDKEAENIAEIERLMKLLELGGPDGGPILLCMSTDSATRLLNVLQHATQHGCDEGLRALWAWINNVVMPALSQRLDREPKEGGSDD